MNAARLKKANRLFSILLALILVIAMLPASIAYADTSYDYQPENAKENDTNSLKVLNPLDITFIGKDSEKYVNQINGTIDGTKVDGIKFIFSLTAGMGTFSEENFIVRNLPKIVIYDSEGKVAAQYSEGNGNLNYLGSWINDDDVRVLSVGVDQGVLDSGDYKIVFGKEICGNNTSKILGHDIEFNFHVKASPELEAMIEQAKSFLDEVKTIDPETGEDKIDDEQPGCYPQTAVYVLADAIKNAEEKLNTEEDEQASEDLYQALKAFKNSRIFEISNFEILGISDTVAVGDSGKVTADITADPDEDQYKKVTWSAVKNKETDEPADNLIIDELTGRWIATYKGDVYIKATCIKNPEITVYKEITIDSPEGVVAVNMNDDKTSIESLVDKTGVKSDDVTSVKVFTSGSGKVSTDDISYLNNLNNLSTLDLKNAALETIDAGAFAGHKKLQKVVLPETVTNIGDRAFCDCTALTDVEIPSSVTTLGSSIFAGCTDLGDTLKVNAVSPPAFPADGILGDNIKAIRVPYSCGEDYKVESGWKMFAISESDPCRLTVEVFSSGELQTAAEAALESRNLTDDQITDLTISSPEDVQLSRSKDVDTYLKTHFLNATTIDLSGTQFERNKCNANTFKNRINLKYIVLPDTTENIGNQSFYGCINLRGIEIPGSVTDIGDGAFGGCSKLSSRIIINAENPPVSNGSAFPYHVNTIIVPPGSLGEYEQSISWRQFYVLPQMEISLNSGSLTVEPFAEKTINAKVKTYGSCGDTIYWKSSNTSVVSLDKTIGNIVTIKGIKSGTATITASDISGKAAVSCKVTVKALPVSVSSAAYNKIKVSWGGISGADGYYVHRYSSSGKLLKSWSFNKSARSFTETGLTTGTTYYYKVRAYKTGWTSVYSSLKSAKPTLSKPATPSVSKSSSLYVKVKWKGISGETGYQVYRATSKNGKYSKVKSVKMASSKYPYAKIKSKKGKTYYYKVRAYKKVGSKTVYSSFSSPKAYKLK